MDMAKHHNSSRGDALDSLRGDDPSVSVTQIDPPASGPLMVDYRGKTGEDHRYPHEGPCVTMLRDHEAMVLQPGLNLIADAERWSAYGKHPAIKAKLDDGRLIKLRSLPKGQSLYELAERSRNLESLEHILRAELAKPVTAGRDQRRNQDLVALLERRLAKLAGQRPIDVSGVEALAKQSAIAVAG